MTAQTQHIARFRGTSAVLGSVGEAVNLILGRYCGLKLSFESYVDLAAARRREICRATSRSAPETVHPSIRSRSSQSVFGSGDGPDVPSQ